MKRPVNLLLSHIQWVLLVSKIKQYKHYFNDRYYDVYNIKTKFEGQGDALFSHNKNHLWIGYGFRTKKRSITNIRNIGNTPSLIIHGLKLTNPNWYHLDTCFCPIGNGVLMLYEGAFDINSLKKIYKVFNNPLKIIKISHDDATNFACNSIAVSYNNKIRVIGHKYSSQLKQKVKKGDRVPIENDMSEFLLSGGSTKCCVMDIGNE